MLLLTEVTKARHDGGVDRTKSGEAEDNVVVVEDQEVIRINRD